MQPQQSRLPAQPNARTRTAQLGLVFMVFSSVLLALYSERFLASFVYPNIFDLATLGTGHYDPLAAAVLNESVRLIAENTRYVTDMLAAYTADAPNLPCIKGATASSAAAASSLADVDPYYASRAGVYAPSPKA